jgi:hypothetical protein
LDEFQHLDDYALLSVAPNASADEIKQAYRREITKYHPDRYRNADAQTQQYARERSQRITEAYATLGRGRVQPARAQSAAFTQRSVKPAVQTANASQLAAWYDEATAELDAGRVDDAVRALRKIQRVDPFYRDVDDLLTRAESTASYSPKTTSPRKPLVWAGAGGLALLAIFGGVWGSGVFRTDQPSTSFSESTSAVAEASVIVPSTTATQAVVAAASLPPLDAPSTAPVGTTPTLEQVQSVPPVVAETSSASAPPPTEVVPTATTAASPLAEIVPTATVAAPPPTEVVPTTPAVVARPTRVPPTPTRRAVAVESGQVLVADAFDDPGSGWANLQSEGYTLGYRDGAYAITTNPGTGSIFSFGAPLAQGNIVISADVTAVRGSAGLIFGPENSYRFFVTGDGQYRVDQRGRSIVAPTASNAIRRGTNRLSIAAAGRRISLYANGVLLTNLDLPASLQDTTYGFVVLAGPQGGEGVFDALTVRTLPR